MRPGAVSAHLGGSTLSVRTRPRGVGTTGGAGAINTTVPVLIGMTAEWDAAAAANQVRSDMFNVQVLNPPGV